MCVPRGPAAAAVIHLSFASSSLLCQEAPSPSLVQSVLASCLRHWPGLFTPLAHAPPSTAPQRDNFEGRRPRHSTEDGLQSLWPPPTWQHGSSSLLWCRRRCSHPIRGKGTSGGLQAYRVIGRHSVFPAAITEAASTSRWVSQWLFRQASRGLRLRPRWPNCCWPRHQEAGDVRRVASLG